MERYIVVMGRSGWEVQTIDTKRLIATIGPETRGLNAADDVCNELNGLVTKIEALQEEKHEAAA